VIEPRPVTLTLGDIRSLTALEVARANTLAGIRQKDVKRFMRLIDHLEDAPPEEVELTFTLLYAYVYQVIKRTEPEATWAEAQQWRLELDLEAIDEEADAEARASVQAAVLTGLPPMIAGELTQAQLEEYRAIGAERERVLKATSRRRSA
jgi:hypothetical protein